MTNQELKEIKGGSRRLGIGFMIAAGISFIIGIVDGYMRPLACNNK